MHKKKHFFYLFFFSVGIHIFYYISAYVTHTLDIFFDHVTMGQDFFQIPNAVYAFLHGGTLIGNLPDTIEPYTSCCGVNHNVYHPLFTLLVGYPLQLFSPWIAFSIWGAIHAIGTIFLSIFVLKKFSQNKYVYLGLSFFLLFSFHYYEIQHAQYHFLVVLFTTLLLIEILTQGDTKKAGVWFFLSLLVKPVGLLWVIPLLVHKKYKTAVIGIGLFLIVSLPFALVPWGRYYFTNLYTASTSSLPANNAFILTMLLPISAVVIKLASALSALFLLIFQVWKKPPLFLSILQWAGYQLVFYPLAYHYQYTILAGLIMVGFLFSYFSIKQLEIIPIIFLILPTPIVFFYLTGDHIFVTQQHYALVNTWSVLWVFLLVVRSIFIKKYRDNKEIE